MTLLARRREELRGKRPAQEQVEKRRSVAVRPPQPAPSFLHVQAALGNRGTGGLLRSAAVLAKRQGEALPVGPVQGVERNGALLARELTVAVRFATALRPGFLVPDGAAPGPGQMTRSAFLGAMREAAREAAEQGLAGTGHTARGCPWIEHYFRYYQRHSAERIEADLLRYVSAARAAADAQELLAWAAEHVRASVHHWARTGELSGVPRGLPGMGLFGALAGSLAGVNRLLARTRPAGSADPGLSTPAAAVEARLGPGRPLAASVRARMERALATRFGDVRLHTDPAAARLTRRQRAPAFAVGRHVAFGRGEYRPGTMAGDALLAHELAHVAQQEGATRGAAPSGGSQALERDADNAAAGAVARLWGRGRAVPAKLAHPARPQLRAGLSLQRCTPNSDRWFLPYQQRFNELWNQEPYSSESTAFNPRLSSKGPRTDRSRAIFERLYLEDAELREAYDEDKGGLRERIDTYTGPEGLNLINSPRLAALEAVFSRFDPPVSGDTYQEFKQAVATVAGTLNDEDRQAFNLSNEWDRQINLYLRGADQRREIRRLINPPVAPEEAPEETPEEELTQEQKLDRFFDRWRARLQFKQGLNEPFFTTGTDVRYEDRRQLFRVTSSSSIANPGQVLYVRVRVSRGTTVIASPDPQPFPIGQSRMPPIIIHLLAPSTIPDEGDRLAVEVELLESDLSTVRGSPQRFEVTLRAAAALTRVEVEAIAAEDDRYLNDPTPPGLLERMRDRGGIFARAAAAIGRVVGPQRPSGLLGKMSARGGIPANVSEAIREGRLTLHALTERHDSGRYVETQLGRPDPGKVGYFVGPSYSRSFVEVPADAFRLPRFGPRFIVVNRTPDLRNPTRKRSDDGIIEMLVHEAVHALDVRPGANKPLERYKTEFRAYWMDGHLGPPLEGSCPEDERPERCTDLSGSCLDTSYCAELPPPGPKTPRSRSIFNHLYGSPTYDFVKENYDDNVDGFRQAVDQYVIPDGIDLIASIRLDDLRLLIGEWSRLQELHRAHTRGRGAEFSEPFSVRGPSFTRFRARVRAYLYEEGQAPPHGRLNEEEKRQVRGNRAWRNLVERHFRDTDQQRQIKQDLGIPS